MCCIDRLNPPLFGAIGNAFSVGAVLELEARELNKNLVVTDGDRYSTNEEKSIQIARALSGTGAALVQAQQNAIRWFSQFEPLMPDGGRVNPERFLIESARRIADSGQAPWIASFLPFIDTNIFPDPDKSIIYNLHRHFGLSVENIEHFLIDAAVKDPAWGAFSEGVRARLRQAAINLGLLEMQEAA